MKTVGIIDVWLNGKLFTCNTVFATDTADSIRRRVVDSIKVLYPDKVHLIGHMSIERAVYNSFNPLGFDVTAIKLDGAE